MKSVKVAVVQDAPVQFDLKKSLEKTGDLVAKAAKSGASLILFPEAFLPGYPRGMSFGTVVGSRSDKGRDLWLQYNKQAIVVGDHATDELAKMARDANAFLIIGVIEKAVYGGSLYCSLLYFSPEGKLLGVHRKLKPTASERIIWAEGNGSDLQVFSTEIGRMGGLICWENYMPLARMALYQQGIEIYLAPTADSRDVWQSTLTHIALEGRCFVLGCNQFVKLSDYPASFKEELRECPEIMCRGGSTIISPLGTCIAGPLYDEPGILTAELNLEEIEKSKLDFDVIGHYSRPDVFKFSYKPNER